MSGDKQQSSYSATGTRFLAIVVGTGAAIGVGIFVAPEVAMVAGAVGGLAMLKSGYDYLTDDGAPDNVKQVRKSLASAFDAKQIGALETTYGTDRLEALLKAAGNAERLKAAREALGDAAIGALAPDAGAAATPFNLLAEFGDDLTPLKDFINDTGIGGKPQALVGLLRDGCDGDVKKLGALCTGFDQKQDRERLQQVLTEGGLGDAPDAIGPLFKTGCEGNPGAFKELVAAFDSTNKRQGMGRLLASGGLAGSKDKSGVVVDPGCFGQLLRHGAADPKADAKGRAGSLATLCAGLDKTACEGLAKVMQEGGLGKIPEEFAHVVGIACEGKAGGLKDLTAAFDTKERREGLAQLIGKAGLSKQTELDGTVVVDPTCLARLVALGVPDAANTNIGVKSTTFAALCEGLSEDDCKNLSGVVREGGLGTDPEVLGHLLGVGCQGDPAKLQSLGTAFKDVGARTNLKALVTEGALGTRDAAQQPTGIKPECLGELLNTGCAGSTNGPAQELAALVKSFGDKGERDKLGKSMTKGGLGERPKVLGHLYKSGCQTDPYDPASVKNPAMLQSLTGAFGTDDTEAQKLKDLLTQGGLGDNTDASKQTWLGKVVRDGFTARPVLEPPPVPLPSGQVQNPANLKDLHAAFTNGGNNLADLKDMIDAMGTMPPTCGDNNEPGKALQNVLKRANLPIAQLHGTFMTQLKGAPNVGTQTINNRPVTKFPLASMVQTAASFEFDTNITAPNPTLGVLPHKTDMTHILHRHNRRFQPCQLNGANLTTLLPAKTTETDVQGFVTQALADCGPAKTTNPPAHNPPTAKTDLLNNGQRQYKAVVSGAISGVVGFKWIATAPPPPDVGDVTVGQWYPTGGPGIIDVLPTDMTAIKTALGK